MKNGLMLFVLIIGLAGSVSAQTKWKLQVQGERWPTEYGTS